jgi:hypothetical protein
MIQYAKRGAGGVRALGLAVLCCGSIQMACAPNGGVTPKNLGGTQTTFSGALLTQPNYISGSYAITPQPFPDAEWVIGRKYPGYPVYGLYAYTWTYGEFREDIRQVGWKFFRMGGQYSDDDMLMLMEDDVESSFHVADGPPRSAYPNEEAFLGAAEQRTVAVLERYGPGGTFFESHPEHSSKHIKYVHVWNEPNFHYLISTQATTQAAQQQKAALYGKLLLRVSGVIRERWPSVQILGFDTGRANPNSSDFIRTVYESYPSLHDAYDILATHPGVDPVPPEADNVNTWGSYSIARNTAAIRDILRAQSPGGRKRIWFTEGGWKIPYSSGGLSQSNPEMTVSPLMQAAYVCRYYATALRLAVDRVTPFFIVDTNTLNGGFFDGQTKQWRPSAYAVQNMIAVMPAPKLIEVLQDGEDDGLFVYRFRPDATVASQDSVIMAWNVEGPKQVSLELGSAQIQIVDMLGGTATATGTGTYDLDVGPYPIYIKGSSAQAPASPKPGPPTSKSLRDDV